MTIALALLIIFVVLLVAAIVFLSLPQSDQIKWTPAREAIMYKTSFWLFMAALASIVLSLLAFAKGL